MRSTQEQLHVAVQEYLETIARIQDGKESGRKIRPTDRGFAIHLNVLTFRPIRSPEITEQFKSFHRDYVAPYLLLNQEKIPTPEVSNLARGRVESLDPHQASLLFVKQLVAADVWQILQYLACMPNLVIEESVQNHQQSIQAEAIEHHYLVSLANCVNTVSREGLEPPTKKV